jgi:hypothetical protein
MCIAKAVGIAPARSRCSMPAVIEAILRLGCAVEIDDDFQASQSRPVNGSIKVRSSSLYIRAPRGDIAPVSNGNAYEIEARVLDLPEIVERHEALPMGFEDFATGLLSKLLAQRPLVNDRIVRCAVTLKDGRCDEAVIVNNEANSGCNHRLRLQNQPSTEVDSANFIATPTEIDPPLVDGT